MIFSAEINDADELTTIALQSKAYWNYTDELIESWRDDLTVTPNMIQEMLVYKYVTNEQIQGFYILNQPKDKSIELEFLFILPEAIGKGIGKKLLKHAFQQAKQLNSTTMTLLADPNAESFYNHYGFIRVAEKESSIPNRFLPVMEKDLVLQK